MSDVRQLAEQTKIQLEPHEWFRATWRDLDPLPRPAERPSGEPNSPQVFAFEQPPEAYVRACLRRDSAEWADGFAWFVLPYLTRDERLPLQQIVNEFIAQRSYIPQFHSPIPPRYLLAAYLGLNAPIDALIAQWRDGQFGNMSLPQQQNNPVRPADVVFGLENPEQILVQMRRLDVALLSPALIRAWYANTEYAGLDVIVKSLRLERGIKRAQELIRAFGCAHSPLIAPPMFEIMNTSRGGSEARRWLVEHPHESVQGLLPLAEERGRDAEKVREFLKGMARGGHAELIEQQASPKLREKLFDRTVKPETPIFNSNNTPAWLAAHEKALHEVSAADVSAFIDVERLPLMMLGSHAFNARQVEAVLLALSQARSKRAKAQETARRFLKDLKQHIDQPILDRFVGAVIDAWVSAGTPMPQRWILHSLAALGSDQSIARFAQMMFEWASQKRRILLKLGLEALAETSNDAAIAQLYRMEQRFTIKNQRALAHAQIEALARLQGLTKDQFGDRVVPDCGLDADGSHTFDFGARRFRIAFDSHLTPVIRDAAGKIKPDLPKPTASDDPDKAEFARGEWRLMKTQLREATKTQAVRLERLMVNERRWTWAEFEKYYLQQPFLRHFMQGFIWGCYAPDLRQSFKLNSEFQFVDARDNPIEPDQRAHIGLAHPIHLTNAENVAWGQLLADYAIIQPFSQIGREIYRLTPEEEPSTQLTRMQGRTVHVLGFEGGFVKLGWNTSGGFGRYYPGADVTAVGHLDYTRNVYPDGHVILSHVAFHKGQIGIGGAYRAEALPLKNISALVISEVIRDLTLVFKG